MDSMLGIFLGIAYVVPPGPVNIETLRRGLRGGFRVALALQLGAVIGDLLWALLALTGVGLLLTHPLAHLALCSGGMVVLVYLGWSALGSWRDLRVASPTDGGAAGATPSGLRPVRGSFWTGMTLALATPVGPTFWLSIGGISGQLAHDDPIALLAGFVLGNLVASLGVAVLAGCGRAVLSLRLVRVAASACGITLMAYGLAVGYTAVGAARLAVLHLLAVTLLPPIAMMISW
jgi:chemosensory pili system protein ChpE